MFDYIYLIPCIFLIILSIVDIKTYHLKNGLIPSIITSSGIFLSFVFNLDVTVLVFSLLMALLLFDLELFDGMPDLKAFVICGAIMPNIYFVLWFGLIMSALSTIYKYFMKKAKFKEIPFLPVMLVSYIGVMVLMSI